MQKQLLAGAYSRIILSFAGMALLLAGCAGHKQASQVALPPVGHVYPVAVTVPPPVSGRIKFSAAKQEQVQQAFNVVGLRSALMVGALSCNEQDKYDKFMTSFQPHILAEQHIMDAYFRKASGPYSGRKMEDSFVTLLANNQSGEGVAEGSLFCLNNAAEFEAVLALKTPEDLDHFVTDQAPVPEATVASSATR